MAAFRGASAPASRRPSKPELETARVVVPFEDNRLLTQLLGEYDSHLALIEDRLGIDAHAHGNVVILTGPASSCAIAREVLEKLYMRTAKGEAVGAGDFDGLIRHARSEGTIADGQAQVADAPACRESPHADAKHLHPCHREARSCVRYWAGRHGQDLHRRCVRAQCLERGLVERIILSRPAVEAGERLGFLPGDMREKVDPYLRPLYDALYDVLPPEKVERDIETGVIEIAPLAFMRGRTLANAFVILDEAQNTTSMQMKMFLTRIGEGSKMVVTGDPSQIDLLPGMRSGLDEAVELLADVDDISAVRFGAGDIVRRDLVAKIVDAYEKPK